MHECPECEEQVELENAEIHSAGGVDINLAGECSQCGENLLVGTTVISVSRL